MKNENKIAAFDLDGTLLDSADDLINSLNMVLEEEKIDKVLKKHVHSLVGNGALAMIKEAYKINNQVLEKGKAEKLKKRFLSYYKKNCLHKSKLYPYALNTLQTLKKHDFKLILVSNKPEYFVIKILRHFNIHIYFSAISGGDTFNFRKPDMRHLSETIRATKIKSYKCWFIGDNKNDAICARNFGAKLILLKHGYSKENVLSLGADYVLSDLKELSNILLSYS